MPNFLLGFLACLLQTQLIHADQPNTATLRFVQAIWRHGDRSIIVPIPTDTENSPLSWDWANGMGQLTDVGMQQHYQLGSNIRKRYAGFLSNNFDPRQVRVESSFYNHTMMSALANMQGMFPATTTIPGTNIKMWKPVPVFARATEDEVFQTDVNCPAYDKALEIVLKSKDAQDTMDKNKVFLQLIELDLELTDKNLETFEDFVNFLWQKSGFDLKTLTLTTLHYLDTLVVETAHAKTNPRPAWANETVMAKYLDLVDISSKYYYNDNIRRRLRGGPMLKEVIQTMEAVSQKRSALKCLAYSVHDFNIIAMLETLGAYAANPQTPHYATALVMELHENPVGNYIVEVHHFNETSSDRTVPVPIADCPTPCTLAKFKQRSQIYLPGDWDKECGNKKVDEYDYPLKK